MQEIIHAFGIDWRLIVIQIFNFGLLAGVLWYFLYTPILKILAEREEKIKKGVLDAEAAAVTLNLADEEKNKILTVAHGEATSIVQRASEHAEQKGVSIVAEAHTKAEKLASDARAKAEEIKAQAHKESESEIAQVAILAAEKILNTQLSK
ncbi:MAG: F0F1 ATP synthase subunit B [Candidatus Pacebacteria bacterium]|nr:F0F1 ATP synthase subunit B [Candidatus Paceibacterota bacterium]MCF7857033.1 F0F1 ATP synthase subunit B [Candidatus Paceibacterota bacterium]